MKYLLTFDSTNFITLETFTIQPGGTQVFQVRTFDGVVSSNRRNPDGFQFTTDTALPLGGDPVVLSSEGKIHFLIVQNIVSGAGKSTVCSGFITNTEIDQRLIAEIFTKHQ
jgi:hypothetical protein